MKTIKKTSAWVVRNAVALALCVGLSLLAMHGVRADDTGVTYTPGSTAAGNLDLSAYAKAGSADVIQGVASQSYKWLGAGIAISLLFLGIGKAMSLARGRKL